MEQTKRVICEECRKEDKRSTVREFYRPCSHMPQRPIITYYDESGNFHNHTTPHCEVLLYKCSNDHEWHEPEILTCNQCGEKFEAKDTGL